MKDEKPRLRECHDYYGNKEGRMSEVPRNEVPRTERLAVVLPLHPGKEQVRILGLGVEHLLSPDQAYAFGNSLRKCAVECGYDPDTGVVTPPS